MSYESIYMDQILPGLWLGSQDAADDIQTLNRLNIKHILSLREQNVKDEILKNQIHSINYRIWIEDDEDQDISQYFDWSFSIIDNILKTNQSILIHCHAGISRSASIVIAYIIRSYSEYFSSVENVIKCISQVRIVDPNSGFRQQLEDFYWKCQILSYLTIPNSILS